MIKGIGHFVHHRGDHGTHTCLHSLQHQADEPVIPERCVTGRNQRDDHKGRNDRGSDGSDNACQSCQLVTHHNGPIDCNGAGGGLSDSHQVKHFVLLNPVVFVHKLALEQGDDDIASPKGKGAQIEGGEKEFFQNSLSFGQGDSLPFRH